MMGVWAGRSETVMGAHHIGGLIRPRTHKGSTVVPLVCRARSDLCEPGALIGGGEPWGKDWIWKS
jgi:hypothetical protein